MIPYSDDDGDVKQITDNRKKHSKIKKEKTPCFSTPPLCLKYVFLTFHT